MSKKFIYYGSVGSAPAYDPDAQAFLDATGITDVTISDAINTLVVDLKSYGLWTKMRAVYPYVGGTATTHKWNLIDPRDLDIAFRITFVGGMSHDSNGVTFGGVNGQAQSNCYGVTASAYGFGFYSRTNSTVGSTDIYLGAGLHIYPYFSGKTYHRGIGASPDNYINTDSRGLFHQYGKSVDSTAFLNGVKKLTGGSGAASGSIIMFGLGSGASNRNHAFGFITNTSFTDVEASDLYALVQTFQTSLSRQV